MHIGRAIKGERIKAAGDPVAMKRPSGTCRSMCGRGLWTKVAGKRHLGQQDGMGDEEGWVTGAVTLRPRPGNAHKLRFNACKLPASTSWVEFIALQLVEGRWTGLAGRSVAWSFEGRAGRFVGSRCVSRNCHFALERFRARIGV